MESHAKNIVKLEVSLRKEQLKKEIYEHAKSMTTDKNRSEKDSRHYAG